MDAEDRKGTGFPYRLIAYLTSHNRSNRPLRHIDAASDFGLTGTHESLSKINRPEGDNLEMKKHLLAMFLGSLFVPVLGTVFPETLFLRSEPCTMFLIIGTMSILAMFAAWIWLGFLDAITVIGYSVAYVPSIATLAKAYLEMRGSVVWLPVMMIIILAHIAIGWTSLRDTKAISTFVWTAVLSNNVFFLLHPPFHTLFLVPVLFLGTFVTASIVSRHQTTVI